MQDFEPHTNFFFLQRRTVICKVQYKFNILLLSNRTFLATVKKGRASMEGATSFAKQRFSVSPLTKAVVPIHAIPIPSPIPFPDE